MEIGADNQELLRSPAVNWLPTCMNQRGYWSQAWTLK
jgi:hypothetical protein